MWKGRSLPASAHPSIRVRPPDDAAHDSGSIIERLRLVFFVVALRPPAMVALPQPFDQWTLSRAQCVDLAAAWRSVGLIDQCRVSVEDRALHTIAQYIVTVSLAEKMGSRRWSRLLLPSSDSIARRTSCCCDATRGGAGGDVDSRSDATTVRRR